MTQCALPDLVWDTLMSWLLSDVYPKSWTFQFPRLCQWAGAQKAVRMHGQESWPDRTKWTVHSIECHAQTINWERLAGRQTVMLMAWECVWHQSAGSERLCCITCFFLGLLSCVSISPFFSSSLLLLTIAISISITPDFPLHPTECAGSSCCMIVTKWG